MSKTTISTSLWKEEVVEFGLYRCIAERLSFHGTLFDDDVSTNSGASRHTVRKYFARLVRVGKATYLPDYPSGSDKVAIKKVR